MNASDNYFDDFTSGIRKENRSTGIGIKGNIPKTCSSVMIESEDPLVDEWYDLQRCKRYINQMNNHGNGGTLASTSAGGERNEDAQDRLWADLVTKKEQLDDPFLLTSAHITICSDLMHLFSNENKETYAQIMQALDDKQKEAEEKEKESLLQEYGFDENHVLTNATDTKVREYKYKHLQRKSIISKARGIRTMAVTEDLIRQEPLVITIRLLLSATDEQAVLEWKRQYGEKAKEDWIKMNNRTRSKTARDLLESLTKETKDKRLKET